MSSTLLFRKPSEPRQLDLADIDIKPFHSGLVYNTFDCGAAPLNKFLKNRAKKQVPRREVSVYCATLEGSDECLGYYALQLGSDTMPESVKGKRQDYSAKLSAFPAVNLSYLAVHSEIQGQGVGKFLLQDVFERVAKISELAGFYALTLQSYDKSSTDFYTKLGFETYSEGGGQPKMLYPLQTIIALIQRP